MLKKLKIVIHIIWAVTVIVLSTGVGAIYGWNRHGWMGAIALGFVGFVVGALLAASPSALLQLWLR